MYKIGYFKDKNGNSPIEDYLRKLRSKKDKDSRIKSNKILEYLDILRNSGAKAGEPYIKHLQGEIWELRPLRDRILFAAWDGEKFLLLTRFMKSTQKTPKREIDKAIRNLADMRERGLNDE